MVFGRHHVSMLQGLVACKCCDELCLQTPEEDGAYLDLRQENDELLHRIADVQQQMWTLEEKVLQSICLPYITCHRYFARFTARNDSHASHILTAVSRKFICKFTNYLIQEFGGFCLRFGSFSNIVCCTKICLLVTFAPNSCSIKNCIIFAHFYFVNFI